MIFGRYQGERSMASSYMCVPVFSNSCVRSAGTSPLTTCRKGSACNTSWGEVASCFRALWCTGVFAWDVGSRRWGMCYACSEMCWFAAGVFSFCAEVDGKGLGVCCPWTPPPSRRSPPRADAFSCVRSAHVGTRCAQAKSCSTTLPPTSVSRKSRPSCRYVSLS